MKTFLNLILQLLIAFLILVPSSLHSQSPLGIPYQAVMRNVDGTVMASNPVSLTFMIHDGSATGTVVYQESHALTSNTQGLVSCVVGYGVVSQGNFANINWGSGAKFLHVMMGTTDLGTQQMLSVPYALYSNGIGVRVGETGDTLSIGGNSVIVPGISAANANNNNIPTSGLGAVVLPGNNTCADQFINVVGCNGQTSLTYDGRTYDLVEIGGQCWFADNLATDQYRNGDPIPTGLDNTSWQNTTAGAYAIYNNDPVNDVTYGKLYNWYTTVDTRGLCPTGWHVPTDCEWMYLENSLGMSIADQETVGSRGTTEGGVLKATTNWNSINSGATNSSGFTAFPGAVRNGDGSYVDVGIFGYWWSTTQYDASAALRRGLAYFDSNVYRLTNGKSHGFSVRCLKDSGAPILQGCTDGSACNFLAGATQDDGSCLYQNATCDDGDANTTDDVINSECVCAGTILPPPLYTMGNGVTDIDGNFYPSIIINGQEWMQKNLAVSKYRNGDPIPTGLSDAAWGNLTSGAYAIYNNDAANNTLYGKLYNWYAVNDSRGLCPTGWHVPSDDEWTTLETSLGGSSVAGGKMKSITGWTSPNTGATNESGFTALPGGDRYSVGTYTLIGMDGYWWSATEYNFGYAWDRSLGNLGIDLGRYDEASKNDGSSVRCLKDSDPQILQGCTDGSACNFLANATQDDGSCLYQNANCDDGDANTVNDVINASCQCAGALSLSIGQDFQGGKVAYIFQPGDAGYVAGEMHGLIAAAQDLGIYEWGCYGTSIAGADGLAIGTGAQNTLDIVAAGCGGAAAACANLELNGYDDWFLPCRYELQQLYENRSAIGGFQNSVYCSSSWYSSNGGWYFDFIGGNDNLDVRDGEFIVRAVRAF